MRIKFIAAMMAAAVLVFGTAAYANSSETSSGDYSNYSALDHISTPAPTSKATRNISTEGNGHIVDNVDDTENEKLQFITVTAKDGSVFYVVIDKQNSNDNVYFLNTVDMSDLEALTEDYSANKVTVTPVPSAAPSVTATPVPETTAKSEKQQIPTTALIPVLAAVGAVIIGGYYFKVVLPKKKLEEADDLEDFDFEDSDESMNEYYTDEMENKEIEE